MLKGPDVPPSPGAGAWMPPEPWPQPTTGPWEKDTERQSLEMMAVGSASILEELCQAAAARRWW